MENKKYQVRIRKELNDAELNSEVMNLLGGCSVSEIRTLTGEFKNLADAFEKMATVKELADYEIISIILIDVDNSEQLGEDFDWDEAA